MLLSEKRYGRMKVIACENGSTQMTHVSKDEASSPTAATESVMCS